MKSTASQPLCRSQSVVKTRTVLVKQSDIATGEVDGVRSTQAGHCGRCVSSCVQKVELGQLTATADDDDSVRHFDGDKCNARFV